jgi:hypothetical protein
VLLRLSVWPWGPGRLGCGVPGGTRTTVRHERRDEPKAREAVLCKRWG